MYDNYPIGKLLLKISTNGDCKSPDIFQQKMNELFHVFEFICAYINYLLVLTK